MQTIDVKSWENLSDTVFVPHNESEYNRLVEMLDNLIDEVGEDESHPLASLMDVLSTKTQMCLNWLWSKTMENYLETNKLKLLLSQLYDRKKSIRFEKDTSH